MPRSSSSSRLGVRLLRGLLYGVLLLAALVPLTILALRWLPLPTTSFMLQSPTRPVSYHWVPAARIAEVARRAVVASEDQKFWTHHGFDVEAMQKAYEHNQKRHHRIRGASTISQQTAKNLFLWPGGGYFRKGVEAGLTVLLENLWGKDRILEVYLNIAEFGPGIYGVEAASQAFFGKHASQLSASEAARLAAVLPNPRHWSARAPGAYVQRRAEWIMGQMGYGSRGTPVEEPEPPASELPNDDETPGGGAMPPEPAPTAPEAVPQPTLPAGQTPPADSSAPQPENAQPATPAGDAAPPPQTGG
ncbi:MAG: monofunctional biosynthetic peptidoglycan transglycosylase, partial [Stenotrophobium sp.]